MKRILIAGLFVFIVSNLVGQDSVNLIGIWKMEKYDAFDKVKNTPAYLSGTGEEIQRYDDIVRLLLDSTIYDFRPDGTMVYTDMENQKLVKREAWWTIKDSILYINELKRPYKREAKIVSLTSSLLIMTPIIDGKAGDSKMTFKKKL
jgi:hypothetical protein